MKENKPFDEFVKEAKKVLIEQGYMNADKDCAALPEGVADRVPEHMTGAGFATAKHRYLHSARSYADLDKKVALLPRGFPYTKKLRYSAGRGLFWDVRLGNTEAR